MAKVAKANSTHPTDQRPLRHIVERAQRLAPMATGPRLFKVVIELKTGFSSSSSSCPCVRVVVIVCKA